MGRIADRFWGGVNRTAQMGGALAGGAEQITRLVARDRKSSIRPLSVMTATAAGEVAINLGTAILPTGMSALGLSRRDAQPEIIDPIFLDNIADAMSKPLKSTKLTATPQGLSLTADAKRRVINISVAARKGSDRALTQAQDRKDDEITARALKEITVLDRAQYDPVTTVEELFHIPSVNTREGESALIIDSLINRATYNYDIQPRMTLAMGTTRGAWYTQDVPMEIPAIYKISEGPLSPELANRVDLAVRAEAGKIAAQNGGSTRNGKEKVVESLMDSVNGEKLPERASNAIIRGFLAVATTAVEYPDFELNGDRMYGKVMQLFIDYLKGVDHRPVDLEAKPMPIVGPLLRRTIQRNDRLGLFKRLRKSHELLEHALTVERDSTKREILNDQLQVNEAVQDLFEKANRQQLQGNYR